MNTATKTTSKITRHEYSVSATITFPKGTEFRTVKIAQHNLAAKVWELSKGFTNFAMDVPMNGPELEATVIIEWVKASDIKEIETILTLAIEPAGGYRRSRKG